MCAESSLERRGVRLPHLKTFKRACRVGINRKMCAESSLGKARGPATCPDFSSFYARENGDFLIFSFSVSKYRKHARIKI